MPSEKSSRVSSGCARTLALLALVAGCSDKTYALVSVYTQSGPPAVPAAGARDVIAADTARLSDAATACDPVRGTPCGASQSCTVACSQTSGAIAAACTVAGPQRPGQSCDEKNACAAGSQCFDF